MIAGPQKHTAIPAPPVSVGVAKSRTKFVGAQVPRVPPAEGAQHAGPGTNACELAG